MENLDVLRQVYNECVKGLQYIAEPPTLDYWQTPKETEQKQGGDCEDLAIWMVCETWERCQSTPKLFLVWGLDAKGQGHAWGEYESIEGMRYWFDPAWKKQPDKIGRFVGYQPWLCAGYDGATFSEKFVYGHKLLSKLDRETLEKA